MADVDMTRLLANFDHTNTKRWHWEKVLHECMKNPIAIAAKVTQEGNTLLHLAVIDNRADIVAKLLFRIEFDKSREKLKHIKEWGNERGNNPLHLAAALGSFEMCVVIASAYKQLVDDKNKVGETPVYVAASYGNTDAFYYLYNLCKSEPSRIIANCRVNNGDNILHCALRNEHFDLAFQIIHFDTYAANFVNEDGITPLHVLASKPSCFKSGANISRWRSILYNCIPVHPLKPESIESLAKGKAWEEYMMSKLWVMDISCFFPPNYETCIQFFAMVVAAFFKVLTIFRKKSERDLEKGDSLQIPPPNTGPLQANEPAGKRLMTKFLENCKPCVYLIFQIIITAIMIILEGGIPKIGIRKMRKKKQKHVWAVQVMEKLIGLASDNHHFYPNLLQNEIVALPKEKENSNSKYKPEAVLHLAVKNGVIEIVMEIYKRFPWKLLNTRESDGKNIVHLAAEHRQSEVYKFLLSKKYNLETLFRAVDKDGNSALHLAAGRSTSKLWHINGAALQMQWEVEWYKLVKESMPLHFFALYNEEGKTASTIFEEKHMDLVQKGKDWLYNTSQSCTLVATLIATVAFATAAIIPGSNDNDNNLVEKERVSYIFAISSLVAVSLSTTSVIMFLAVLTARFDIDDYFGSMFPWKLLIGLSSLYSSIIAMLISFCTGSSYFLINHHLPNKTILLYTLIFLPVPFILAIVHLPLYYDLLLVLLKIMPKRQVHVDLCD